MVDLTSIKLVVWDLDGTFWDGTLSEEGATFREDMLALVVRLNEHGVMCSIASNNDHDQAKALLVARDAWQWFVFPQIHWGPKPQMLEEILRAAQLRPENVVFLDDKPRLREAAARAIPQLLATSTAERFAADFAAWAVDRAPHDRALARLRQYQLLERKHAARIAAVGMLDEAFLRASHIRCRLLPIVPEIEARVRDLATRANQLNFTRRPVDLEALAGSKETHCGAVHVEDDFGDYGITGFYALRAGRLEHFLFSCRTLDMGIEAAVYEKLGRPDVACDPAQASLLARTAATEADWVTFVEGAAPAIEKTSHLTLIGPCELRALADVAGSDVEPFLTFTTADGRDISHFGHHGFLDLMQRPNTVRRHARALERLPWFDAQLVDAALLTRETPQRVVLSAVRNAQCASYVHQSGEFCVPIDFFRVGGVDFTRRPDLLQQLVHMQGGRIDAQWFAEHFTFTGPVTGEAYERSLAAFARALPAGSRLWVVNVAHVDDVSMDAPEPALFAAWKAQHRAINDAIAAVARAQPDRLSVLDVNAFIRGPEDFVVHPLPSTPWTLRAFDPYYHFQRRVIVGLADALARGEDA
jgi:FkbH-like protein